MKLFFLVIILLVSISCNQTQHCSSRTLAKATQLLVRSGWSQCLEVFSWRLCKDARSLSRLLRRPLFGEDEDENNVYLERDEDAEREGEFGDDDEEEEEGEDEEQEDEAKQVPISAACRNAFNNAALAQHNMYRSRHGASPLSIRTIPQSQQWADKLARGDNGGGWNLVHNKVTGWGENLAGGFIKDARTVTANECAKQARNMIDMFYEEKKFYNPNNPVFTMQAGHFTQLVWKSSQRLSIGLGVVTKRNGMHRLYGVFNYNPPGNFAGRFRENVQK